METTWVYRSFELGLWTVGHYEPSGKWHPESDHEKREDAARRVHFLNGGCDGGGVRRKIDEKFSTDDHGNIVKRSNSEVVPEDEPLFLLRARDRLAVQALSYYREISKQDGCNDFHFDHLDRDIAAFVKFSTVHPERMKQPSITRGK